MSSPKPGWTDRRVERIVGELLRAGVLLAAAIVVIGGALYLIQHGATPPHYRIFRGEPSDLRSVPAILADALSSHGRNLIQFGLLLLMATPMARVALLVFAFARQHDRTYTIVALIVLALLLFSLTGAGITPGSGSTPAAPPPARSYSRRSSMPCPESSWSYAPSCRRQSGTVRKAIPSQPFQPRCIAILSLRTGSKLDQRLKRDTRPVQKDRMLLKQALKFCVFAHRPIPDLPNHEARGALRRASDSNQNEALRLSRGA